MNDATHSLSARIGRIALCLAGAVALAAVLLGSTCNLTNKAPSVPVVSGPNSGVVGVPVTFKATATDPDGDSVAFQFDWGDSSTLTWTDAVASEETTAVQHAYSDSGTFTVKARVRDKRGKETGWSVGTPHAVVGSGHGYPDSLLAEIVVQPGASAGAITPNGQYLYVAHGDHDFVTPIRLADNSVLPAVEVDNNPFDVVASPDGSHMYVSCMSASSVVAIRTSDNTVDGRVLIAGRPRGIAITPDGQYLYVASSEGLSVIIVRSSDLTKVDSVAVDARPVDLVANPTEPYVYVGYGANAVGVIRTTDHLLVDTVEVGDVLTWLAVTSDGSNLLVANQADSGFAVVRTSDNSITGVVNLRDSHLDGLAAFPGGRYALATTYYGLRYVDMRVNTVVDSLQQGAGAALAVDPQGARICILSNTRVFVVGRRGR